MHVSVCVLTGVGSESMDLGHQTVTILSLTVLRRLLWQMSPPQKKFCCSPSIGAINSQLSSFIST